MVSIFLNNLISSERISAHPQQTTFDRNLQQLSRGKYVKSFQLNMQLKKREENIVGKGNIGHSNNFFKVSAANESTHRKRLQLLNNIQMRIILEQILNKITKMNQ